MAISVNFIGERISDCESATNWAVYRLVGAGGGTWSSTANLDTEDFVQGSNSLNALGAANNNQNKPHAIMYDYNTASGVALNWSTGSAKNQLLWLWAKVASPVGIGQNMVGLGICLSSAASSPVDTDSAIWNAYKAETYPGGWVRLVCDPTNTVPTASGGSFNLASVNFIGVAAATTISRQTNLLWIDAVDIGSGIYAYGTGDTEDLIGDISTISESGTNKWGALETLEATETAYKCRGILQIGDSTSTNSTEATGTNSIIILDQPNHTTSYTTLASRNSISDSFPSIQMQGNTTGSTNVSFGIKVDGATTDEDTGRNGVIFIGNGDYNCGFQFNDDNVDSLNLYGCTLRNFQPTGGLIWDAASNHDFVGSFLDNCSQLTPDSGVRIRNSTFQNHPSGLAEGGSGDAAMLFKTTPPDTEVTDIKNSSFVSNFYAIEHADSGTYLYDNLTFSDNTADIHYSNTGLGDLVIQATAGSDPTTAATGNASNTVTIQNTITLTITNVVGDGAGEKASEVRIFSAGTTNEVAGEENVITGQFEYSYQGGAGNVDIRVFNLDYQPLNVLNYSLPAQNSTLPIQQIFDRNYTNP